MAVSLHGGEGYGGSSRRERAGPGLSRFGGERGSTAASPLVSGCNTFLWHILEAMRHIILIYCGASAGGCATELGGLAVLKRISRPLF